jgi:hypothetical protein
MSAPADLYALTAALDAAHAICQCAAGDLPVCHDPALLARINHLGSLVTGIELLLKQAKGHADALSAG